MIISFAVRVEQVSVKKSEVSYKIKVAAMKKLPMNGEYENHVLPTIPKTHRCAVD
jgi:hypothetical protein